MITTKTKIYAVLRWFVSHSLSPFIHNFWFDKKKIDALYIALSVKPESIATMIPLLKEAGFSGFNVTLPHKEAVFDLCDVVSPIVQKIDAVNTLKKLPLKLLPFWKTTSLVSEAEEVKE